MKVTWNYNEKEVPKDHIESIDHYIKQIEKLSDKNAEMAVIINKKDGMFLVGVHWHFKKLDFSFLSKSKKPLEAATHVFSELYKELKARRDKKFAIEDFFIIEDSEETA